MTREPDAKYDVVEIVSRRDFGPDLWAIRVQPGSPFDFRAGQYATLGVEVEGQVLERPYSIVSAPQEPEIEFFIELIPEGLLTPHLYPLGVGSRLLMRRRPKGIFLRQELEADRTHLMVATVTGIAPFMSWLRQLDMTQSGEEPAVLLLQGASFPHEFGYLEETQQLASRLQRFTYIPTVSRPWAEPGWTGETGRAEDLLRKYGDSAGVTSGHGRVYLCGHPEMISNARAIMRRGGLAQEEILEEQYWPEGKAPTGAEA